MNIKETRIIIFSCEIHFSLLFYYNVKKIKKNKKKKLKELNDSILLNLIFPFIF